MSLKSLFRQCKKCYHSAYKKPIWICSTAKLFLKGGWCVFLLAVLLYFNALEKFKAPYSSKIDIFFIQERFNELIYGINTIIKYGIWQPVKFKVVSRFWTGSKMKWFLSYLYLLVTLIQRYDKNHFISFQERQTIWNFTGCATSFDGINTIYQFIKPVLDNKRSIFEEYGTFNVTRLPSRRLRWNATSYFPWKNNKK